MSLSAVSKRREQLLKNQIKNLEKNNPSMNFYKMSTNVND